MHISKKLGFLYSRRMIMKLLDDRQITVNGKLLYRSNPTCDEFDEIHVCGKKVESMNEGINKPFLYGFYKKRKLICTEFDPARRPTIIEYLKTKYPEIFHNSRLLTVGRLDYNAEGLILLTNNGELKRKLENKHFERKYLLSINKEIDCKSLNTNLLISNIDTPPKFIAPKSKNIQWLEVTSGLNGHYGKNMNSNIKFREELSSLGILPNRIIRMEYGPYKLSKSMMIERRMERFEIIV